MIKPSNNLEMEVFGFVETDVIEGSWKAEALRLLAKAEQSGNNELLMQVAGLIKAAHDKMQSDILDFLGIDASSD